MKNMHPALLYFVCLFGIIPVAESAPHYSISKDGSEVTDKKSGLVWRRCTEGMSWNGKSCTGNPTLFTYQGAVEYAATQSAGTALNWRLPLMEELFSIVDKKRSHPTINSKIFPETPATLFWVMAPAAADFRFGWAVDFEQGYMNYRFNLGEVRPARLVRNAQ